MATIKLSQAARQKYLEKKMPQKIEEPKPVLKGREKFLAEQEQSKQNKAITHQWLAETFPRLFCNEHIPFEIGISRKIKDLRPSWIATSSIDYWMNKICRSEKYLELKLSAESGLIKRFTLEELK